MSAEVQNRGSIYKKVDNIVMLQNTVIFCDKCSLLVVREQYVLPAATLLASCFIDSSSGRFLMPEMIV